MRIYLVDAEPSGLREDVQKYLGAPSRAVVVSLSPEAAVNTLLRAKQGRKVFIGSGGAGLYARPELRHMPFRADTCLVTDIGTSGMTRSCVLALEFEYSQSEPNGEPDDTCGGCDDNEEGAF